MSAWIVAWFVIGLVTSVALLAFVLALVRQALILGRTARRLNEEAGPLAREIADLGARASGRATGMQGASGTSRRATRR